MFVFIKEITLLYRSMACNTIMEEKYSYIHTGVLTLAHQLIVVFVVFVALRPKSTAMVIAGRSVHLTTLFPGQACTSG